MLKKNDPTLVIRRGKIVKVCKEEISPSFRRENNLLDVEISAKALCGQEISTPAQNLGLSREDDLIPNFSFDEPRGIGTLINDRSQPLPLGATAEIRDVILSGTYVSVPCDPNHGIESDTFAFQEIFENNETGISNLDKLRDRRTLM